MKTTNKNDPNVNFGMYEKDRIAKRDAQTATGAGNSPREKWAMVYNADHHWLVGFDGGGRPVWSINRLRAGMFAPSEIDLPNVQFIEAS